MTVTPVVLYTGGQLTTSAATLFTSPANTKSLITDWSFVNTDAVARLLTVYVARSGGAASAANVLLNAIPLAAGQTYRVTQKPTLGPGDFIQAKADAGGVVTCPGISGFQVVGS